MHAVKAHTKKRHWSSPTAAPSRRVAAACAMSRQTSAAAPQNPSAALPGTAAVRSKRCSGVQSANCRVERWRAEREGPSAPLTAFPPFGSVSIELLDGLTRRLLVPIHMEAITQPLQLVRQLYAARSEADGDDFGVKARFESDFMVRYIQMPCDMPAGPGGPDGAPSQSCCTPNACRCPC